MLLLLDGYDCAAGGICGVGGTEAVGPVMGEGGMMAGATGCTGAGAGGDDVMPAPFFRISANGSTRSIGSGKTIVEFFSTAISVSV